MPFRILKTSNGINIKHPLVLFSLLVQLGGGASSFATKPMSPKHTNDYEDFINIRGGIENNGGEHGI